MNGPKIDGMEIDARVISIARGSESLAQLAGDLAGKVHVEALLADAPGNQAIGAGEIDGEKAVDGKARRLCTDQVSGAAIREDEERQ